MDKDTKMPSQVEANSSYDKKEKKTSPAMAMAVLGLVPLGYWLCLAWHRLGLAVNGYAKFGAAWAWLLIRLGLAMAAWAWLWLCLAWCRLAIG